MLILWQGVPLVRWLVQPTHYNKLPALEQWVCSFSYWDVLRLMDLSWRRGGLLRGERVFNQYRNVMPVEAIEQCTRRFATVATNLSTGRELWFTEGDLHLAVRASCSIPGLMSPVAHNGYWLVDGRGGESVPVSLTRALGADIVIAVDLQHDAHLMQQDLLSFNVSSDAETGDDVDALSWRARLKERLSNITARRAVTAPTAMEIMTTSIQVLENRLKRNRMAGDPPGYPDSAVLSANIHAGFSPRQRSNCCWTTGGRENG